MQQGNSVGKRSHSVSSCTFGTESNSSCCHCSTMEWFSLSRRHVGEDIAAVTSNPVFQVLSFLSAHSRKVTISLLAPQSGAAPWTRSLCPPSGLCPACLAPLRALSEAAAGSRAGEIPQNKANYFPLSLELVAGTVTLARCCGALVGRQLQWAPSATDTAPCFSSTQELGCRPRQSASHTCALPRHALVVFGGLEGLEAGVDVDPNLEVTDPSVLFDFYLNTCPSQGSRTIRTEVGLMVLGRHRAVLGVCLGQ